MIRDLFKTALITAMLALAGCTTHVAWNQKLTVEVSTPDGVKSGSSVVGFSASIGQQFASSSAFSYSVTGEATVVEVAPGKYLFALLDGANELGRATFENQLPQGTVEDRYQVLEKIRGKADVPRDHYPMLVTFADINDPKTVHEMKPDQVSSIFGAGYSLKSITLEITDEPITEGKVESVLGWIKSVKGRLKPIHEPIPVNYKPIPKGEVNEGSSHFTNSKPG